MLFPILIGIFGFVAGLLAGLFVLKQKAFDEKTVRQKIEKLNDEASQKKNTLLDEARAQAIRLHTMADKEIVLLQEQNRKMELHLETKEQLLQKKNQRLAEFQTTMQTEEQLVTDLRKKASECNKMVIQQLITRVGLDPLALKEKLLSELEYEWKNDGERRFHHLEAIAQEHAAKEAKNKVEEVMYRFSAGSSVDRKSGEIVLQKDAVKGRIVGRGGKNIVLFEELFGVDVVFNDEPNTISLSCFNLVNREIAKLALQRLIREKIIDEVKITNVKEQAMLAMNQILQKEGADLMRSFGLKNIHPDLMKLIGRLNYRTSYGQNVLHHCIEVGFFSRLLAAEIGGNEEVAFLGGFFHDIGKAIDQEIGGSHDVLTKEILEKYGFPADIVHAAWAHHDAIPQETIEALLVKAADAISAGRPGARSISLDQYLHKIRELEETANSFEGVKKAYAISAGREVRILVDPDKRKDEELLPLADEIADKIEAKGGYPGKIKVTTIRLTKASDMARAKMGHKT